MIGGIRGWHLHAFNGLLFQIRLGKKVQKDTRGESWPRFGPSPVNPDHNESKRLKAPKHKRNHRSTHQWWFAQLLLIDAFLAFKLVSLERSSPVTS